jgi:hypothetical protein
MTKATNKLVTIMGLIAIAGAYNQNLYSQNPIEKGSNIVQNAPDIFENIPEGFTLQILGPTGGKILKPKDWFYTESHQGPSLTWILSKEDANIGKYDTGVRIQAIVGIKEKTGISAEESLRKYLLSKKEGAKKLFHECEPKDQGLFTNMCIHVEEGPYRIFYSIFWSNDLDIAIIMTGGAKLEDWGKYEKIFEKMGHFRLIDMPKEGVTDRKIKKSNELSLLLCVQSNRKTPTPLES